MYTLGERPQLAALAFPTTVVILDEGLWGWCMGVYTSYICVFPLLDAAGLLVRLREAGVHSGAVGCHGRSRGSRHYGQGNVTRGAVRSYDLLHLH